MNTSLKMRQLESRISDLQKKHQHLLAQRQQDIAALITTLDLVHIEDKILIGGLMFLKDKITTQSPIMEGWLNAGERFLRQIKSKKCNTSKTNVTTLSSNQLPQKHSQSREK